jgi:acetyltransferase-like isoleucine patch superfamily enzyme
MTEQQRRYTAGGLGAYRDLTVGSASLLHFLGFELYSMVAGPLGGALGYATRAALLPFFLRSSSGKVVVGRNVTIRQPKRVSCGKGVVLDDFSVLDVRITGRGDGAGIQIEENVLVGRNSLIVAKDGEIILRRACNISSFCRIATQSRIEIGESVLIAAYVYIGPGNHIASDPSQPLISQGMDIRGGVTIGDHAWIGAHSTVLDGVKIGKHAIIGAHSLVREDVPENAIVAGVPAKVIRYR